MLLTRLPVGWVIGARPFPEAERCVWAYPLVGALVGALGWAVFALCRAMAMPPLLAAVWTVAAMVLVTGGLHEDGLSDVADGFGGGRTRERKLAIMRDSRVGSYGVLALVLAVAVRVVAIASMPFVGPALIAAGALSRAAMVGPALLPAARADGLGAALVVGWRAVLAGAVLGGAIGVAALPGWLGVGAILVACGAAAGVAGLARGQIGGFTGDVLGGCAVVTECAVLSFLA